MNARSSAPAIAAGRIHPGLTAKGVRLLSASPAVAWDAMEARAALRSVLDHVLQGAPLEDVEPLLADHAAMVEDLRRAYAPVGPDDFSQLLTLREELADAAPGKRVLQFDETGKVVGARRLPSTYPWWMGRRTRAEADRKIRAIDQLLDGRAAGLLGGELLRRSQGIIEREWSVPNMADTTMMATDVDCEIEELIRDEVDELTRDEVPF